MRKQGWSLTSSRGTLLQDTSRHNTSRCGSAFNNFFEKSWNDKIRNSTKTPVVNFSFVWEYEYSVVIDFWRKTFQNPTWNRLEKRVGIPDLQHRGDIRELRLTWSHCSVGIDYLLLRIPIKVLPHARVKSRFNELGVFLVTFMRFLKHFQKWYNMAAIHMHLLRFISDCSVW